MVIDEMEQPAEAAVLEDALTKGRKHGLRIVRASSQRRNGADQWGKRRHGCFAAASGTFLVLGGGRADSKTAEDLSRSHGEHEVERETLGRDHENRGGGRSRTTRIERERVVIPQRYSPFPRLLATSRLRRHPDRGA